MLEDTNSLDGAHMSIPYPYGSDTKPLIEKIERTQSTPEKNKWNVQLALLALLLFFELLNRLLNLFSTISINMNTTDRQKKRNPCACLSFFLKKLCDFVLK